MLRAGSLLVRRYRLVEQIGRGGMGVVWRARDVRLDRDVALKVLHPWVADDPELRARFEREAAALARLDHPGVVRLYDVLDAGGATVLVLELVDGSPLSTVVAGRRLPWDEARRLCAPIAAALAHAHARGVVHRDLTPANVLVERGTGRVVVTDLGLARLARTVGATAPRSGVLAGTPEYWAPEQAAGRETDAATDLYALGCILFHLLSGRLPFEDDDRLAAGLRRAHEPAPTLSAVAPGVDPDAARLVDALLSPDPERRPDAAGTAAALGADAVLLPPAPADGTTVDLEGELPATLELHAAEPTTVVRRTGPRPRRRHRRLATAAALTAAVGLAGGVYAVAGEEPSGIDAPDLVGRSVADARAAVTALARDAEVRPPTVRIVDRSYSESVPRGAVIAQDPGSGARVASGAAVLVSVSKGSAYAAVPSVTGLEGPAAVALLERAGFVPRRRYAPSAEIAAWHAIETDPPAGARLERPAHVDVRVSTGPPKAPVPRVAGLDTASATAALRDAGFVPAIEARPSTREPAGTVLAAVPASGERVPLGASVTLVVAREPRWEAVTSVDGEQRGRTGRLTIPAGARLVVATVDESFLGLLGDVVEARWSGDVEGETEVAAGDSVVLVEPSGTARVVEVEIDGGRSVRWRVAVEAAR